MTTFAEFVVRLRNRLSVDSSYDTDIGESVRRYVTKLLRDYNFPKSIQTETFNNIAAGTQAYTLPDGLKRELLVMFRDNSDLTDIRYGTPLRKRTGFTLPEADRIARWYWLQGTQLWTDITITADDGAPDLLVVYQSLSFALNIDWLLADFEDILFTLSMFRLSSELGKPELTQVWTALWVEDQRSLAIYLNELEFNALDIIMREARTPPADRYPVA